MSNAESVRGAWAVIVADKQREMDEIRKAREQVKAILRPLERWQQKALVEGLYWYGGWRQPQQSDGVERG